MAELSAAAIEQFVHDIREEAVPIVISLIKKRFADCSPFLFYNCEKIGGARITIGFPVTMGDWDDDGTDWVEHDFRLRDLLLEQAKSIGEHKDWTTREAIASMRADLDEAERMLPSSGYAVSGSSEKFTLGQEQPNVGEITA